MFLLRERSIRTIFQHGKVLFLTHSRGFVVLTIIASLIWAPIISSTQTRPLVVNGSSSKNEVGTKGWMQTYGGLGLDKGFWIEQTVDDGYIITGATASYGAGGGECVGA